MKNVEDLKNEMDLVINRLQLELENVKHARAVLNANQFSLVSEVKKDEPKLQHSITKTTPAQVENRPVIAKDKTTKGKQGRKRKAIPLLYPYKGTETDKVRFILHNKNRAISETEFYDEIVKNEGPDADSLQKLDRTLRGETHPTKGDWTYFQFSNRGLKFYIRPEWKDKERNSVIFQYKADVSLSGLDAAQCDWTKLIWHHDK